MTRPLQARRLALVDPSQDNTRSVAQYLEEWLWGKQALRPSTQAAYEIHVRRYLVPHLGSLSLTALGPADIERMHRSLASGDDRVGRPLTPSTVRRVHATLMSALNTAVKRGLIDRNPAATVELPRPTTTRTDAWTAAEFREFLDAIADDRLHMLYLLLGVAGLRRGEAVALRWRDVDLNSATLRVEQSAVRVGSATVIGSPKSTTSIRTIALDEETARRLHWHQCRQRLDVLRTIGSRRQPDLVFTTREGGQLDPTFVSRHFDRLQRLHMVRRIRLHDLRHTSASLGLAAGESLVETSRRLGHSSITVTADIYSHISPEVARESAERLAATIYGKQTSR